MDLRTANSPFFAVAHATDIRELDQRVRVDAGRIGKFRSTFVWDQLPHSYSEGRTLFTETSPGFLQVSPAIRTSFQNLVDGQIPQVLINGKIQSNVCGGAGGVITTNCIPPGFFDSVRSEMNRSPTIDLRVRRDLASFQQLIEPSANW